MMPSHPIATTAPRKAWNRADSKSLAKDACEHSWHRLSALAAFLLDPAVGVCEILSLDKQALLRSNSTWDAVEHSFA